MLTKSFLPLELTEGKEVAKVALLPVLKEIFPGLVKLGRLSELSLIELPDGAKILRHNHTVDKEWWIIISNRGIDIRHCLCGSSHQLINHSGDEMYIIAIKWLIRGG